jgi:predicted nucleic acid-binding protein
MRPKVFDNSVLCHWWRQWSKELGAEPDERVAVDWARRLAAQYKADAIVTPVRIEFICGARNRAELDAFRAFLSRFRVIDEGRVLAEDWAEAERLAAWTPRHGRRHKRRRQLGDCLIRAIAKRLKHDVLTFDTGFPS